MSIRHDEDTKAQSNEQISVNKADCAHGGAACAFTINQSRNSLAFANDCPLQPFEKR